MKRYYLIIILCILAVVLAVLCILPFSKSAALCTAIQNEDTNAIEEHINSMDNVNQYSLPLSLRWFANVVGADAELPLVVACREGNKAAVEILLANGADPNIFLDGNWSAMEAAFVNNNLGRLEIAKMLIASGADVNLNGSGTPALFLELQHYIYKEDLTEDEYSIFEACVTLLLENGATPMDQHGNTYIHYLASKDDGLLIEKWIKEFPVDVNCQNSNGVTALMWAAENGAENAVKLLIRLGADISHADEDGKTALDYATENGYDTLIQMLTE